MIEIKSVGGRVLYTAESAVSVRTALEEAVSRGADLAAAYLAAANLAGAYLRDANLRDANLRGANLAGANLAGANLRGANLAVANLAGANLRGANLAGAKHAEIAIAKTRILPDEGSVVGWKKARNANGPVIVKLSIPDSAKRSHGAGRKCRASKAKVLSITNLDGVQVGEAHSLRDSTFKYRVGEVVEPTEPFDTNMWDECSSGIHFYITRLEAEHHA